MNIKLQEHFFRALNEDYYDSEDIIALAKQTGAFADLLDSLKACLEYDEKNKCWVYLRGDVSGRDFYTGVPIQYISDNEKSNLAEEVIEDGVLEYYDWDGLDIDEVKEFMYDGDSLIDSLISSLSEQDGLDEHLISERDWDEYTDNLEDDYFDGKISKAEYNKKLTQYDKMLDEAAPSAADMALKMGSEIKFLKKKLMQRASKYGVTENFGQREIRMLSDKYAALENENPSAYASLLRNFTDWCANYEG